MKIVVGVLYIQPCDRSLLHGIDRCRNVLRSCQIVRKLLDDIRKMSDVVRKVSDSVR